MSVAVLRNKFCFITGAASGIGKATAIAAAGQGARLVLTDVNDAALAQVVASIRAAGGEVLASRALDIAVFEDVQAWAAELHAAHGSFDVLMNIAGVSVWGPVEHLQHRHWRHCVEVNLMGPIHVIECFLPAMIAAGRGGHLVNVSSAAGLFGLPWHAPYSAAKFGLRGISEVLRFDLRRHGIGVSLVCPGGVDTGLVRTIEIVGIDTQAPAAVEMRERFRKHAITPEAAASAILDGIRRNRYLVFTSSDIRIGHWLQRMLAPAYEWIMRRLNDRLHAVAQRSPVSPDLSHMPAAAQAELPR